MLIPHSNAGIKRVFSLVNKNKNESSDRNRLDSGETISAILKVKLHSSLNCNQNVLITKQDSKMNHWTAISKPL